MREINTVNEDDLIDAIYELALDTSRFDDFIYTWENFLSQHESDGESKPRVDALVIRHFERAFETMQRALEGVEQAENRSSLNLPTIELDKSGKITRQNALAEKHVGANEYLQDATLTKFRTTVITAIGRAIESNSACPILVELEDRKRYLIMLFPNPQRDDSMIANILSLDLNNDQMSKLAQLYELSVRETEIARLLYQGLAIRNIAEQQNKALDTVRKQTKAILYKTGTHSQAQLMRIMASLNLANNEDETGRWQYHRNDLQAYTLADGRRISYYDSGRGENGTIIVLHGVVHSPVLPEPIHQHLEQKGYRIMGVARAWFGHSSPPPRKSNLLDTSVNDLNELTSHLKLTNITLIGIQAGSLHALRFATSHPHKVKQIFAIAGMVPIRSEQQLQALPIGVRAVAKSARYLPSVLPALISGGLSLLYKNDFQKIFNIVYRNSPIDLQATKDPIIFDQLKQGFLFALNHGYHAYATEGTEIMQDMSEQLVELARPVTYINGELDGLTDIESVQSFCDEAPERQLVRLNKLGNLFMYSAPQRLINVLDTLLVDDSHQD